jgi:hypothetical protein
MRWLWVSPKAWTSAKLLPSQNSKGTQALGPQQTQSHKHCQLVPHLLTTSCLQPTQCQLHTIPLPEAAATLPVAAHSSAVKLDSTCQSHPASKQQQLLHQLLNTGPRPLIKRPNHCTDVPHGDTQGSRHSRICCCACRTMMQLALQVHHGLTPAADAIAAGGWQLMLCCTATKKSCT